MLHEITIIFDPKRNSLFDTSQISVKTLIFRIIKTQPIFLQKKVKKESEHQKRDENNRFVGSRFGVRALHKTKICFWRLLMSLVYYYLFTVVTVLFSPIFTMPSSHLPFATNSGVIIRGAVRAASNPRFSPALCYFRAFGDDLFVCG